MILRAIDDGVKAKYFTVSVRQFMVMFEFS